jgi:sortase A
MGALPRILGRVLLLMGALFFASWGYLTLHALCFQRASSQDLDREVSNGTAQIDQAAIPNELIPPPHHGDMIGRLDIPRINISVIVLEGSDSKVLNVAAGHVEGTAFPGETGNMGIAAHRDTFFRSLRNIRPNDRLTFRTPAGMFEYTVANTEVVEPNEVEVLRQTPDSELTLVTCYPFDYIGAAPKRFIVHARQQN